MGNLQIEKMNDQLSELEFLELKNYQNLKGEVR